MVKQNRQKKNGEAQAEEDQCIRFFFFRYILAEVVASSNVLRYKVAGQHQVRNAFSLKSITHA